MKKPWLTGLEFGLPDDFDFTNLRSPDDASSMMFRLPNSDRGSAAREIVSRANQIGRNTAYQALIEAWDHDHVEVYRAFETGGALVNAFQSVSLPSKRSEPVRIWRGCNHPDACYGLSWTLKRDCACWFALRFGSTPYLFACDIPPKLILAEHHDRGEHEIVADCRQIYTFLDEGDGYERYAEDVWGPEDVSVGALNDWKLGRDRWAAQMHRK